MRKFKTTCANCGSDRVFFELISDPYWDDGVNLFCAKCGNKGDLDDAIAPKPNDLFSKPDPVTTFHQQRGCCDGSDPAACARREREESARREQEEREARRIERERNRAPGPHEYEGTETTGCSWSHVNFRMGDKCPHCGFVA